MRVSLTLLLMLLLAQAAGADADIEDLLVRRKDDNVNIRVTVHNPSRTRQPGPIVIELHARAHEGEPWTPIKTWKDVRFLQPGYRVSRDFFEENNAYLRDLAARGAFEVRATVRAPGQAEAAEKISTYNTETGR